MLLLCFLLFAPLLPAQPSRIVSTAPGFTEILYALGLGDRVAGVTNYCHYPPEATRKPKIGSYTQPNLEVIASLRPDLVLVQSNPIHLTERLQAMRLKVLELDLLTLLPDIYSAIRKIGEATGTVDRANALAGRMRSQLEEIRVRNAGSRRKRVLFLIGRTPGTLEGLVTISRKSFLDELIVIAGGENIVRDAAAAYPKLSMEEVLARNPEVIIDMGDMTQTVGVSEAHKREVVALWNRYPSLAAVREHQVFAVASDIYVVPGPRIVEAAREFARMVHQ